MPGRIFALAVIVHISAAVCKEGKNVISVSLDKAVKTPAHLILGKYAGISQYLTADGTCVCVFIKVSVLTTVCIHQIMIVIINFNYRLAADSFRHAD